MITAHRNAERQHQRRDKHESWLTFPSPDVPDAPAGPFGSLELLGEDRLPPGAAIAPRARHGTEIITYVREGAIAYQDSTGRSGVIHAGEFQRMTSELGVRYTEMNASR